MMARPRLGLLSDLDKEFVHEKALWVLETVGVGFNSEKALSTLESAGARVNRARLTATIPGAIIEQALEMTPRTLHLAARDPAHDLTINDESPLFCTTDGEASLVMNDTTGEVHEATVADLAHYYSLFDALPEIDYIWTSLTSRELDPTKAGLDAELLALSSTSKHVQSVVAHNPVEVPVLLDVLEAIAGASLAERPIYSSLSCPLSPLQFEGNKLDATLELARHGVPILVVPVPQLGTTAPMSVLGAAVVHMAELLAANALYQIAAPGCQVCSCVGAAVGDMRTGGYLCGTPEVGLLNAVCIEMAKTYGLPTMGSGITSDAKTVNYQAGSEGMLSGLVVGLAGADILLSAGLIDSARVLTPAKLILDCDAIGSIRRLLSGIAIENHEALLDDIAAVGIGGHYLSQPSTRARWRAGEVWQPRVFQRGSLGLYEKKPLTEEAQERADALLAAHEVLPLAEGVRRRVDSLLGSFRVQQA
ncbi:MAG: trimethylamine methyltransferase family protein [Candidatus Bipolaricaulia bacterium]